MERRDAATADGETSLPVTRWSLVARAGQPGHAGGRDALSELLTRYLPALRAHLLARRRVAPGEVDDLLQGFVASKVLEQQLVTLADRQRGRFRTFLLTSLDHYVLNARRGAAAAKRTPGGGRALVPLEPGGAESGERHDVADPASAGPDPFDVVWAQEVVREAVRRTRFECEVSGRSDLWALFDARVVGPLLHGREVVPYEQLVARLQFDSPAQATNALATAKRTFVRMLRAVVAEYAEGEAEIEDELNDLKRILAEAGPREA